MLSPSANIKELAFGDNSSTSQNTERLLFLLDLNYNLKDDKYFEPLFPLIKEISNFKAIQRIICQTYVDNKKRIAAP
jgi:hypothetical protein